MYENACRERDKWRSVGIPAFKRNLANLKMDLMIIDMDLEDEVATMEKYDTIGRLRCQCVGAAVGRTKALEVWAHRSLERIKQVL